MLIRIAFYEHIPFEGQLARDKITQSVTDVVEYFKDANDVTLNFNKMTNQDRDTLCTRKFDYIYNNTVSPVGIHCGKDTYTLYHDNTIARMSQPAVDKVICHELGHTVDSEKARDLSVIGTYIGNGAKIVLPLIGAVAGYKVPEMSVLFGALGGYVGGKTVSALSYWPSRINEKKADNFSDRMVPEMTTREMFTEMVYCNELASQTALGQLIEDEIPLQRLAHAFHTHPSNYIRNKRSDKNCPLYLEQKKQLGIPSLIFG